MTELTAEKIRLVALVIAARRITGHIPEYAEVSQRQMERISHEIGCPVSARDIARLEQRAIRKARLAALAIQALSTKQKIRNDHAKRLRTLNQ